MSGYKERAHGTNCQMITFWEERDVHARAKEAAAEQGITLSDWLRDAVQAHLARTLDAEEMLAFPEFPERLRRPANRIESGEAGNL